MPQPCTCLPEMCIHQCGQELGAETWALEIRPGETTGVGCAETVWRGWSLLQPLLSVYLEETWAHLRGQAPLSGGCARRGKGPTFAAFSPACALRWQNTTYRSSRSSCEPPPLPLQALGAHMSSHHWQEPQDLAPAAVSAHPVSRG